MVRNVTYFGRSSVVQKQWQQISNRTYTTLSTSEVGRSDRTGLSGIVRKSIPRCLGFLLFLNESHTNLRLSLIIVVGLGYRIFLVHFLLERTWSHFCSPRCTIRWNMLVLEVLYMKSVSRLKLKGNEIQEILVTTTEVQHSVWFCKLSEILNWSLTLLNSVSPQSSRKQSQIFINMGIEEVYVL